MKIVEVCVSNALGGLELYCKTCCDHLKKRGHEVLPIVIRNSRLHDLLKRDFPCVDVKDHFMNAFSQTYKAMSSFHPDIIHVHHKVDLFKIALLKKIMKKHPFKFVHTRHMDLSHPKRSIYHQFIYRSIDLMIAITDRLKNQILDYVPIDPKKVVRLYHGVPGTTHNIKRCTEFLLDHTFFNIALVSRIDGNKNQMIMVEALKKLETEHIKVYMIGDSTDNSYFEELKSFVKHNQLEDRVYFWGFVNKPHEIMKCFDLVVLTSYNETFGLVLPEAMSAGVAVIGARGGGVPEIIDHKKNGLLFEIGNPEHLSICVREMMNKSLRKKYALAGKQKANTTFEMKHHFDELENFFNSR